MPAEKHNHGGHRERMKASVLTNGADGLKEIELLEMLLYYVVPRVDTKPIAMELIEKFGSVEGILNAEQGEISKITGLKDNAEVLFILLRQLVKRCGSTKSQPSILEPERMKKYLVDIYKEISVETVYAFYFSRNGILLGQENIFRGKVNSAKFSLRLITEGAIKFGGTGVVLAHNHPSNTLVPSMDDILSTKRMATHLLANDIELLAHYIVGKDDAVCFYGINY